MSDGAGGARCPFCGGAAAVLLCTPDRNRRTDARIFTLRRCAVCGLIALEDPPADLAPYYAGGYHGMPRDAAELDRWAENDRPKLDLLLAHVQAGRLLEIGPGIGMFARLAQRQGFAVSTIEIDPACVRFMRESLRVRAIESADPAAVLGEDPTRYDAICLWHAIEHLRCPWAVIAAAAARLDPGGVLLVATPNPDSRQARLLGPLWPHWDAPRHLFLLPPAWLTARAAEAGLRLEHATTRDAGGLYWNRFTWAMLGKPLLSWRNLGWRLGMRLGGLLDPWDGAEGKGAAYTAVFRRPPP